MAHPVHVAARQVHLSQPQRAVLQPRRNQVCNRARVGARARVLVGAAWATAVCPSRVGLSAPRLPTGRVVRCAANRTKRAALCKRIENDTTRSQAPADPHAAGF